MLEHTLACLRRGSFRVAYFGGSITEGAGASDAGRTSWRALTTRWFRERFPEAEVAEIQAAIGGTGSDLGIYRCDRDVIEKQPDLVFIEFAVNDWMGYDAVLCQIETLIRKLWRANPLIDLVFTFTATASTAGVLAAGGEYASRSADLTAAHRYGIPSVDFGEALRTNVLLAGGDWRRYTTDTVHPNDEGYRICADCLAVWLEKTLASAEGQPEAPHTLPEPLCAVRYENAGMKDAVSFDYDSREGFAPVEESLCGRYPRYLEGTAPGASLTFTIRGTCGGVYWMLAKDGGDLLVSVDGGEERHYRAWDTYCLDFNRAAHVLFFRDLPEGEHRITLRVADTKEERSTGHAVRIAAILTA